MLRPELWVRDITGQDIVVGLLTEVPPPPDPAARPAGAHLVTAPPPANAAPVTEPGLTWAPTAHYRRLTTVALLPLLAAVILGHPGYLAFSAPMVAALALAARRPGYGAQVSVQASSNRCFEGERLIIRVSAEPAGPANSAGVQLTLPPALAVIGGPASQVQGGGGSIEAEWQVSAQRWGRWDSGQVLVTVRSRGGLFAGTMAVSVGEITVFPHPPSLTQLALPAQLHTRIGDHVDRRPADGIEFAGVRPFTPGDRLHRVNWPVTSRRGSLHVNQFAAERAAEIVAVIDAITDTGPPGDSSLDRAVRGGRDRPRLHPRR